MTNMRTPEKNRLIMQEALEKAFPQAEQIRTFTDDCKDKENIFGRLYVAYVARVIINGRQYGYNIVLSDIDLKTANFDLFAHMVERVIEAIKDQQSVNK